MFYASLNDDGTLTPTGPVHYPLVWEPEGVLGTDLSNLMLHINDIIENGFFPIVDLFLANFETVSEDGLRIFLSSWSTALAGNRVIWNPCWEYNQIGTPGWGQRGTDPALPTYRVIASDFNRVTAMIRKVKDELGIRNILLGSYPFLFSLDSWDYTHYGDRVYEDWLPGMRMADVLGVSSYNEKIDKAWNEAKRLYDWINQPEKTFLFFEYANDYPRTGNVVTAEFVNDSYAKIPGYSFVKAIVWWHGTSFTPETIEAIGINAAQYEGYTPL